MNEKLISTDKDAISEIKSFVNDCKIGELYQHENVNSFFEHGQWFVSCSSCGATWSIEDTEYDLELSEIDSGDESCFDN